MAITGSSGKTGFAVSTTVPVELLAKLLFRRIGTHDYLIVRDHDRAAR
jgi:hypothetical protein